MLVEIKLNPQPHSASPLSHRLCTHTHRPLLPLGVTAPPKSPLVLLRSSHLDLGSVRMKTHSGLSTQAYLLRQPLLRLSGSARIKGGQNLCDLQSTFHMSPPLHLRTTLQSTYSCRFTDEEMGLWGYSVVEHMTNWMKGEMSWLPPLCF